MSNRRPMTVASSLVAMALAASAVLAASPIEDRQAAMKAVGKATGELAKIAKKETKFDAATVKANAEIIHDKLGVAKALFPEGSGQGQGLKTRALPEIWTDHATFEAALTRAEEASLAMSKVTSEKEFMPALEKLGGACKNCHDKFRKPEK
jgi:cytochrome c556